MNFLIKGIYERREFKLRIGIAAGIRMYSGWPIWIGSLILFHALAEAEEPIIGTRLSIEIGMLSAGSNVVGRMFEGGDALFGGEWIRAEIESFQAAHPEIAVETIAIEKPSRFAHPIETTPDLAKNIVGIDSWSGYDAAWLAQQQLIRPIDSFLPDKDFSYDAFHENAWDSVTFDGKRWGVPWTIDPVVLACNWTLFQAAGLNEPPKTWVEFKEFAKKLTKDTNGDGVIDQWGFREQEVVILPYIWVTKVVQAGVSIVSEKGIEISNPANREAYDYIRELQQANVIRADGLGTDSSDRCGMQIVAANQVYPMMHRRNFRLAPLPTDGREAYVGLGRLYLAVRRSTPEKERASWEFIKWVSRPNVSMPRALGRIPARKDFTGREDFRARVASGPQDLDVLYRVAGQSVDLGPHLKGRFPALLTWYGAVSTVLRGGSPFDQAMQDAERKGRQMITPIKPVERTYAFFK